MRGRPQKSPIIRGLGLIGQNIIMKEQIKKLIYSRNDVSFPELMKAIPESAGDCTMCHDNDNLILWGGMSQPFLEALQALLREGSIELQRVSATELALIHGFTRDGLPDLPIANRIKNYKAPHFLPAVIQARRK